jgi:hypothetical protein
VISVGISSAPKVRSLYERNIEKKVTDFKGGLNANGSSEGIEPDLFLAQANLLQANRAESPADDLSGEDEDEPEHIRVGRSQLWRFTLKTVSPDEIRPQVVKVLQELKVPSDTPGLGGTQVPGGIEFDLVLPQEFVPNVMRALQKLAPRSPNGSDETENPDTFSWYKVKSKRKLPDGKSQVVIWLAQPTS